MTAQIRGPIGPFLDTVQQRLVSVLVVGTCDYMPSGPVPDPVQLDQFVASQVVRITHEVCAPKMQSGQLSFRHLGTGDIASILPEIAAGVGAATGVRVGNLQLAFGIDGHEPQAAQPRGQPGAPQLHANLRVDGFNIRASSGGGIDTAGLANQLENRVKSELTWWAIGAGILLVVLIGVAGLGLYIWRTAASGGAAPGGAPAAAAWDGKSPLVCSGNQILTVSNVTANLGGTGITASANCVLTLSGVNVTAGTAIDAGGNAQVTVRGGSISGSTYAVRAGGNAKVIFSGAKVTGKTQTGGNAHIMGQ